MKYSPGAIIIMNADAPHLITRGGTIWKIAEDQSDVKDPNGVRVTSIPGVSPGLFQGFRVSQDSMSLFNPTKLERLLWEK